MGEDDSSDEDYMSDKFLNPPVKSSCSGLIPKSTKERMEKECAKASHTIPKGKQMEVKREEGLKRAIGEDNIGYKMLIKMGFKGDGGLGRKAEGRAEPIPLEVIDGRKGLGLHNIKKKRAEAIASARQQREQRMSSFQSDFRASMATRFRLERAQRQLAAARHICKRLDMSKSIERPTDETFWPPEETKAKLLAHSELIRREICRSDSRRGFCGKRRRHNHDSVDDYLRRRDDSDFDEFDSHRGEYDTVIGIESDEDEYCDIDAAQHGPIESQPDVILSRLTVYLRDKHFYCFWCGAKFSDSSDLQINCPGPTEDDHE
ncbi:hypothetical protein Aperf_G00000096573 [Anoplocephala perfoliata]